jgi:hypothetical protein
MVNGMVRTTKIGFSIPFKTPITSAAMRAVRLSSIWIPLGKIHAATRTASILTKMVPRNLIYLSVVDSTSI